MHRNIGKLLYMLGTCYGVLHEILTEELPINKMAGWHGYRSLHGFTQIYVARGAVSWGSKNNDAAGELRLWYRERDNDYCLYASKTTGDGMVVGKVIDVFTLHFQKCTDKIKTLLTKKSKFISSNTENK